MKCFNTSCDPFTIAVVPWMSLCELAADLSCCLLGVPSYWTKSRSKLTHETPLIGWDTIGLHYDGPFISGEAYHAHWSTWRSSPVRKLYFFSTARHILCLTRTCQSDTDTRSSMTGMRQKDRHVQVTVDRCQLSQGPYIKGFIRANTRSR
jgi:hypothetical protein